MIKKLSDARLDRVMDIWLEANIRAHDFIPESFWRDNADFVKSALPGADVLVYEEAGEPLGFIGVVENAYIAGFFVDPRHQNRGIGGKLLAVCKEKYETLSLDVYVKNAQALGFYRKHGFQVTQEKENPQTGEPEYTMAWSRT